MNLMPMIAKELGVEVGEEFVANEQVKKELVKNNVSRRGTTEKD